MTQEEYDKIAKAYVEGLDFGYDIIRRAGSRRGYRYYRYTRTIDVGHKVGFNYIKITPSGEVEEVDDFSEKMWALHQEITLNEPLQ